MKGKLHALAVLLVMAVVVPGGPAAANNVVLGSDYLTTQPGTFFDFPVLGPVNFQGLPIGPGSTDTIVQRQETAILPAVGSSDTIQVELVALSLQSVAPVNIGGSFFDVFVTLDPAAASTGTMTIRHEFADGTPGGEGTFDIQVNVLFIAAFVPVGGGPPLQEVAGQILLASTGGAWQHTPPPGALLVPAPPASDQDGNLHRSRLPQDFFPLGVSLTGERGAYVGELASVPVPATGLLLLVGVLGFAVVRMRT